MKFYPLIICILVCCCYNSNNADDIVIYSMKSGKNEIVEIKPNKKSQLIKTINKTKFNKQELVIVYPTYVIDLMKSGKLIEKITVYRDVIKKNGVTYRINYNLEEVIDASIFEK